MTDVKVSVIICCYSLDRLQSIHDAIGSVLKQSLPSKELILSVDHNRELLEKLKEEMPSSVRLVLNEATPGLSETRNTGIRAATGAILAFMDDDAVAEKDWLENLAQHFSDDQVMAVGGRVTPFWASGRRPRWFPEELDWVLGCTYRGMPVAENQVRNVMGCNMAFRAEVFSHIGLFGLRLGRVGDGVSGTAEETELCLRIRDFLPEARILHEPQAQVRHKVPSSRLTARYLLRRSWEEGFQKARIKRLATHRDGLSTEGQYLRHLLLASVPRMLAQAYRVAPLAQAGAILAVVVATGAGFALSHIKKDRPRVEERTAV